MGDLSIDAIRNDPAEYAKGTIRNLADYARFNAGRNAFESALINIEPMRAETTIGSLGRLSSGAWDVARLLLRVGLMMSLALLAIPLLLFVGERRTRLATLIFLTTWLAIALGGSLTANVEPRYAAQIAVLQWLPEAAAAVFVGGALVAAVRLSRSFSTETRHR
jgi:hypothetical protein